MDSKKLQNALVKDIFIISSLINAFIDMKTRYNFYDKIALLLLLPTNIVCFDTSCSIILCNITFF